MRVITFHIMTLKRTQSYDGMTDIRCVTAGLGEKSASPVPRLAGRGTLHYCIYRVRSLLRYSALYGIGETQQVQMKPLLSQMLPVPEISYNCSSYAVVSITHQGGSASRLYTKMCDGVQVYQGN